MNKQPDHLCRQPFINLLKSIIVKQSEKKLNYSIAIDGAWGSGKTWMLNELERQLVDDKKNSYLVFHYNTWENDFYEEPLVALLSVMIETLKNQKEKLKEKGSVEKIITSSILTLTKIAGSVIEKKYSININDFIDSMKDTGTAIKDIKLTKADFNKMMPLETALFQIKTVLQKLSEKKHIILVVDELDRCLPEYAIRVLERLHHICHESQIVSIIAIDKRHLADSIAKVYGKNYDYLAGRRDKELLNFANLYLQKFIDISIPFSNGSFSNAIEGLNGLDGKFEPYSYTNIEKKKVINIDEEYLGLFFKKIMNEIDKRTQEKIISLTTLCHELTIASGATLENYGFQILISEILQSINNYIFHNNERISHKNNSSKELRLSFGHIGSLNENDSTKNCFEQNISNLFAVMPITSTNGWGQRDNIKYLSILDSNNYIFWRYGDFKTLPHDPIQAMLAKEIEKEKIFLEKYSEILEKIT